MATTTVKHTYKLKRGREDAVNRNNPLLLAGEPIVVFCNDGKTRLKIGDGKHYYDELGWIGGSGGNLDIEIDSKLDFESMNPVQNKVITQELYKKVDVVIGKQLSTNDYTNEDKQKLANIEAGATNVIVDTINLDATSENAISNKLVTQAINNLDTKVTNIDDRVETMVGEVVNEVVEQKIENINLDGGEI